MNTPTLNLTTQDSNFGGVVRCVLTADKVQNEDGRKESNPVSYEVVETRPIVNYDIFIPSTISIRHLQLSLLRILLTRLIVHIRN